jgi:hypothetical protein
MRSRGISPAVRVALLTAVLWQASATASNDEPAGQTVVVPPIRVLPEFQPFIVPSGDSPPGEEWLNHPFTTLEGDMDTAIADLDVGRTEPPAEVTQPLILDRIDTMIEMLERACKAGGGGGGQNPSRPANASTLRTGVDKRGPMRSPQQDGRKWAELTPKEREKILQSKTDGFPAGYDEILADYFRKLSRADATPGGESTNAEK